MLCVGTLDCMGDYNAVVSSEDRQFGNPIQEAEIKDFRDYLLETWTIELRIVDWEFTWINNHVHSKLDRALVNTEWMIKIPQIEVIAMNPGCSDHTPLNILLDGETYKGSKPFKFLNCLADHKDFLSIIEEAQGRLIHANIMKGIWQKMKLVKQGMKQLNKEEFFDVGRKVEECRRQLDELQNQRRDYYNLNSFLAE